MSRLDLGELEEGASVNRQATDPLLHVGLRHRLDDLESAAVHVSLVTSTPLPADLERRWAPGYWRSVGPCLVRVVGDTATDHGSAQAIMAALKKPLLLKYLAWLASTERAEFECWLLSLERVCDRSHLAALRRVIDHEVRTQRAIDRARARESRGSRATTPLEVSADAVLPLALAALAVFVHENADRLWSGRPDRRLRRRSAGGWLGRWDEPDAAVAIEGQTVRALLGRFGDPDQLLRLMDQRGLVRRIGPEGDLRWQRRVGEHGRRMSCVGIAPAVIMGTAVVGRAS